MNPNSELFIYRFTSVKQWLLSCILLFCGISCLGQPHIHAKVEPTVPNVHSEKEKFGLEVLMISPEFQHDTQMAMPEVSIPEGFSADLKLPPLELVELEKLNLDSALKSHLADYKNPTLFEIQNVDFNKAFQAMLLLNYDSIKTKAVESEFSNAIRAIYNDTPNAFRSVRGKEHVYMGDSSTKEVTWYEILEVPENAIRCLQYQSKLGTEVCNCNYYFGDSANQATAIFDRLFARTRSALGDTFLFSRKHELFQTEIPANVQSLAVFGIKNGPSRTRVPVIAAYLQKAEENKFVVNLLFYETLF
jgi:hypothetical protein